MTDLLHSLDRGLTQAAAGDVEDLGTFSDAPVKVVFLTIGHGYWGTGVTPVDSRANWSKHSGQKYAKRLAKVYVSDRPVKDVYVDQLGTAHWSGNPDAEWIEI